MRSFVVIVAASLVAANQYEQCYFDAGYVGPRSLLPCLSKNETETGVSWCCMAGHNCVNNACYDAKSGMTYQYGCNDPTYKDPHCPIKGGLDRAKSPWVGLVQCSTTNEGQLKYWACNHPDTCGAYCPTVPERPQETQSAWPWEIQPLPPVQGCDELGARVLALYAPSVLSSTGEVPSTYTPGTDKPSPTRPSQRIDATTASVTFTMTASEIASATPTPTAGNESDSSSMSNAAIAGIAVSASAVVVFFLLSAFFLMRRRRALQDDDMAPRSSNETHQGPVVSELPDEKCNLMNPNTLTNVSDGVQKGPGSVLSVGASTPSPMSTPRTPGTPFHAQAPYATHAELSDDARVIHELPAINERAEVA
ncbi:hypothetical protein CCHL11_09395 [Colletotrichum chlorophyti]|uniref:Uncharacterized protein n=1 Tax=Colletotrichum chlorophyti TaxID=708187 RepID=A0A1Q8R9N5_9PEZI|nr:hypothetical protein CCHL11_09395 [Colletotrichum chlorophyti]